MADIAKFRRGDGIEFDTEIGSASFELMAKDGAFTRIDTAVEPDESSEKAPVRLDKLKLDELKGEARSRGLEVDEEKDTRKTLLAAIEKFDAGETVEN